MINDIKLLGPKEITEIGENVYIEKGFYEKRGNRFYDVVLHINGKDVFIGRFNKIYNNINVIYNNGKILVCCCGYNKESHTIVVLDVLSLYDIVDDTFYSCTKEEALQLFNEKISDNNNIGYINLTDTKYLKNKNASIVREDLEKKKRLK